MRKKVDQNEATSKENAKSSISRETFDGGSKKMTKKMLKVKANAQTAAAAPVQTRQQVRQKNEKHTFIVLQKNVRSMNSSERLDELTQEEDGCRWDAILISETWRASNAETQQGHIFMGSGKIREHTRSWNSCEQEVAMLMSVYFLHSRTTTLKDVQIN